ncbi:unnamed protein product [Adineta ricciae]|uniref:Uncharacterized protein n=1 Tax=Adineta ricciae TaxID=249248 RepID=A0A814I1G0_ADIRI|nr:unnamed protein product [Adineta ricciae]
MSFARPVSSRTHNGASTVKPPLPTLPKVPTRLQHKQSSVNSTTTKPDVKIPLTTIPNQDDLDMIVNNLSTIVKRSEQLLTPDKPTHINATVRRTSSLHMTNRHDLSMSLVKTSNSHHDQLTQSNLDLSRQPSQRRSLRNAEKFSGIKCALPSGTATMPTTCKNFEKHRTPTRTKQVDMSMSMISNHMTPTNTDGRSKSPWRLRFEKFLNHQELTPLSPPDGSVAFTTSKTSSLNKENRTPSFRLPARRSSKIHSTAQKDE